MNLKPWKRGQEPSLYYNRKGEPISLVDWTLLVENTNEGWHLRRVAETLVVAGVTEWKVSTVWLGIDHGWGMGGPPLIFETMIFDAEGNDHGQYRYSTEHEANLGHKRAVELAMGLLMLAAPGLAVTTSDVIEIRSNEEK